MSKGWVHLKDGNAHDADSVVGQELDFDDGRPHEGQGDAANVGAHGRQAQLNPHFALQVEVAHKHRQLQ